MKDFLLIANTNACTYKEFFPLLKKRKVSMGVEMPKEYVMPDGTTKRFGNICWFTTLHTPNKKKLVLTATYDPALYPKYDNYDAIEVGRIKNIPYDYDGVMGVPITILDYDLDNVEVEGLSASAGYDPDIVGIPLTKPGDARCLIDSKNKYARVLIKKNFEVLDCKEPALTMNDITALGITEYPSRQIIHNGKKCQKTYHRMMIRKKQD